jgi:phage gp36-like protein
MYATLDQMLARFDRPDSQELSRLTAGSGGVRDDARIEAALAEASGQMDLYLGTRNTLPLSGLIASQADDLARIACDIARYRLWADRASEEVRARYDDGIRVLEQIASGRIVLDLATATATAAKATASAGPRVMTRTTLGGLF